MTTPRSPFIAGTLAAFLTGGLLAPAVLGAQSPWKVTVTPTLNPLPIGFCGAVRLDLIDPATRDTPRNNAGARVTMADFDMAVTTPDGKSVAGEQVDASHWSACGCQGATAGTEATITATYPAQALGRDARVKDVSFTATGTLTLGPAKGTGNPASCTTASRSKTVAVAPSPVPPPVGVPVAPPPATVAGPPPPPPPVEGPASPGRAAALPAGPAPRNLAVTGNPAEAEVRWDPPTGTSWPTSYQVERWKTADPACCRATSPALPHKYGNNWRDVMQWTGGWTYQVTGTWPDGRRSTASTTYTYPEPETPAVTAAQTDKNTVVLNWKPVQGAAYYVVSGPPSNTAIKVAGKTSFTQTGLPQGKTTWKVGSMYQGSDPATPQQGSPFATVDLTVLHTRFRLVAEAIRVTTETVDAPLSGDGMYDEIYVASLAELHLRPTPTNGPALLQRWPVQMSAVHGDVTNWLPMERVQAGTASASGGVRGNDIISPVVPQRTMSSAGGDFVLWEGELIPGKHDLVLHPTIWEVDQPTSDMARELGGVCINRVCNWAKQLSRPLLGPYGGAGGPNSYPGTHIAVVEGEIVGLGTTGPQGSMVHLERHNQDRPVGLEVRTTDPNPGGMGLVGNWRDKMVLVSSEKIEAARASGTNRIEVRFWDHWNLPNTPQTKVNYLNGDYTLVIRIDRVP